ncbi:MAG: DHA2 family efflux MFS transporter permease subunit [Deltaproteobacteria bacterium]|nr:DHA2 family efflux MFS transporter permease subunit [Deltaproteobacteria bacterium]
MNNSPPSSSYRWLVLGIIMMGTFSVMLNSSIVNVALPHMMNAFGVNRNQIEWVSTGFMLASAVVMPLVGWVIGRVGHKALYLGALALFTFGAAVSAFSWDYNSLIGARIITAIGAGGIQPVGMAIVASLFEPHERGKALGIWGTGVMLGPALGPTLGGYLTDWFTWRAIFSVNLPIGLVTLLAGAAVMKSEKSIPRTRVPFDWWGFFFLSIVLICGLLALSKGQEKGWDSTYIRTCIALTVAGLILFVTVESTTRHPLLDLSLFRYFNYSLSMVLAIFRSIGLFGGLFLLPIFLQNMSGFTTIKAGLWMMPGAIMIGIMMPVAGRLADRYNPRWLATFGTAITGFSLLMYGYLDPLSNATMIIGWQLVRGVGLALMMAPLITAAINSVPPDKVAVASSFLNVVQRVAGSFGIALLNTYVTNSISSHSLRLGELIGMRSENFRYFASHVSDVVSRQMQGLGSTSAASEIISKLVLRHVPDLPTSEYGQGLLYSLDSLFHRASVMGFDNGFVLAGWIVLAGLPFCLLLKPGWYQADGSKIQIG